MPFHQSLPIRFGLIPHVSMEFARSMTWATSGTLDGRYGVYQRQEHCHLVQVGGAQRHSERVPLHVYEQVVLASPLGAVRRVRPRESPLLKARTVAESMAARVQSSSPKIPNSFNRL